MDGNKRLEENAKKSTSPLSTFKVGQTVSGPVESTDSGFKVCLPNGVKGHVNLFCTDGKPTVGEIVQGKVIYVSFWMSVIWKSKANKPLQIGQCLLNSRIKVF